MPSINKVYLAGHLGSDPETNVTGSGREVCNFRVAATEKWRNKDGEAQERTEWARVVAWGKTAELCGQYLSKGRAVLIEGKMQTREWEDKDGNRRWTTEVIADRVHFLGGRDQNEYSKKENPPPPADDDMDDIPF